MTEKLFTGTLNHNPKKKKKLGPLLYSLHINDIMLDIESKTRLFADDCLCYPEIDYMEVTLKFQKNAT